MAAFPNGEEKRAGDFVRNVHPCNVGRMPDGLVIFAEPDADTIYVRVGSGSTVYGPARNWCRSSVRPAWLVELERVG